ncbi:ABC transporter substrate-binding protein [Cohnella silvisoli]|uniref:Sugar ABC transporter substrate-binding protein n=1 Tax=Cohnella silvisoli TaxID=2873699 RepID=A0ABV1KRM9_9BACL|nr:sugar ABC transporter substrate-binding protein [Cohnella silvisoli]MCD9024499.1 sugar ABC transporter substrate-binding protein [Cohnella silvisoli]
MKKTGIFIIAILLVMGVLAACSKKSNNEASNAPSESKAAQSDSPSASESPKAEAVKLTMMTWEGPDMTKAIQESMKKFEDENPGITVEVLPSPLKDYDTKISQLISINQAPDVFMVGNNIELISGAKGQLFDWTSKLTDDGEFFNNFYPGIVPNWQADGKLYGIPGLMNTYGVFYNKKLFKDAGVTEPAAGWTYQQMMDAAKKLAKKESGVQTFGLYTVQMADVFGLNNYAASLGAPFTEGITTTSKVTVSDKLIEAVNLYRDGVANNYIAPFNTSTDNYPNLFKEGKVPMMQAGQWYADDLIRTAADLEWGYAPAPIVDKSVAVYDAVGFASPASVKNPEAVYKLIKYVSTEMYESVLQKFPVAPTTYKPSAQAYFDTLKTAGHTDLADGLDYMLNAEIKTPVRFMEPWASKAQKFVDVTFKNVIDGKAPVEDLKKMEEGINEVIASEK